MDSTTKDTADKQKKQGQKRKSKSDSVAPHSREEIDSDSESKSSKKKNKTFKKAKPAESDAGAGAEGKSRNEWVRQVKKFKARFEEISLAKIKEHPNISYYSSHYPLKIEEKKKYWVLRETRQERPHHDIDYALAIVDGETGNVYIPSDPIRGSVNKKTSKVKGNIWNEETLGCERVGCHQLERDVGGVKAGSKAPKEKTPPLTAEEKRTKAVARKADWGHLLNGLFQQGNKCYGSASVIQVIGWTHAQLIGRHVALTRTSYPGGGSSRVDTAQLVKVTDPVHKATPAKGEFYCKYIPRQEGDGSDREALLYQSEYHFEIDPSDVHSYCEY